MTVFIPLHHIGVFGIGFATRFFIGLFAWIIGHKDEGPGL